MEIIQTKNRFTPGRPQIEIGGVLYEIDNRKSTLDKMQKEIAKTENVGKEDEVALRMFLGKDGFKAITDLDLSVADYQTVVILVQSTVMGISEEEMRKRFLAGL